MKKKIRRDRPEFLRVGDRVVRVPRGEGDGGNPSRLRRAASRRILRQAVAELD